MTSEWLFKSGRYQISSEWCRFFGTRWHSPPCNYFKFLGSQSKSGYGPAMKSIILLSLLSSTAYACPQLQGGYQSCKKTTSLEGLPGLKITQSQTRGAMTYEFITEDPYTGVEHREIVVADGEFRETEEGSDSEIRYKVAYHCEKDRLHFENIVEQNRDGQTIRIGFEGSLRKLGKKLILEKNGSVVLDEAGRISVKPDPEVTICE